MDPDGIIIQSFSVDELNQDPPQGNGFAMVPPTFDNALAKDPAPVDPSPATLDPPPATIDPPYPVYSNEQQAYLKSIEQEAADRFPPGKVYATIAELREQLRSFGQERGFSVTTVSSSICCHKCEEPTFVKRRRKRIIDSGLVPVDKRRVYKSSVRCGCPFKISFSPVERQNQANKAIKITPSSIYRHGSGCFPSISQREDGKRKSGLYTRSIHEFEIKTILNLLKTGEHISTRILRKLVRPLFPPGHSLDAQLLLNFRRKCLKILERKGGEVGQMTFTDDEECHLVDTGDLPLYFSPSFQVFENLIQQAEVEPTDTQQVETYLKLLREADPSFSYRRLDDINGIATGFVWQTGVMRKDFELYGSTLFVDRLGRPLNDKSWPLMTVAMLSGESKVAIASESIVLQETVDAYASVIRATAQMTPRFKLSDIKVIYGDGILRGEKLTRDLGISDSCKLVLDHHHLLSEKIGAWPKHFGRAWAQLKQDCTDLVKTFDKNTYDQCLERIRCTVRHNASWSNYVEKSIHSKRHLFARHLVQHYHLNLERSGNIPAEQNHSSIRSRLGPLYYSTPVRQIHALLRRHADISDHRHQQLVRYHQTSLAKSLKLPDGIQRRALMGLTKLGMELFHFSMEESENMITSHDGDGKWEFRERSNPDTVVVKLQQEASTCVCRFWKAYHLQCPHLLLVHKGFCKNLCSSRWHQLSGLGMSVGDEKEDYQVDICSDNIFDDESVDSVAVERQDSTTDGNNLRFQDIIKITGNLGQAVANVSNHAKKKHFVAELIRLLEIVKGNAETVQEMSEANLLGGHFSMYHSSSTGANRVSKGGTVAEGCILEGGDCTDGEAVTYQPTMKRAAPAPPNNHGKKRLRSEMEMRNANHQKQSCSLCGMVGHKAVGTQCPVVARCKAPLIPWRDIENMAGRLGNPEYFEVKQTSNVTRLAIQQHLSQGSSIAIPLEACHLVLLNTYCLQTENQRSNFNWIEVAVLGQRGKELPGWERAYFPDYQIGNWLRKHCASPGRKKNVLSALRCRSADHCQTSNTPDNSCCISTLP